MQKDIVISLIYSVYKTIFEPERWSLILHEVQRLCQAQAADLACFDFTQRTGELAIHSGCYEQRFVDDYNQHFSVLNPWMGREEFYRMPDTIWLDRDIVGRGRLTSSRFYDHWLRPQGLLHRACAVLSRENDRVVYLSLLREREAEPFQHKDLYALQRLSAHMRQVLVLHRLLIGPLLPSACPLTEIVRRLGQAAIVLLAEKELLAANEAASAMMEDGDLPAFDGHGIGRPGPAGADRLRRAIDEAGRTAAGEGTAPGRRVKVVRRNGSLETIEVVPLPGGTVPGEERPMVALIAGGSDRAGAGEPMEKEKLRWWPLVVPTPPSEHGSGKAATLAAPGEGADEEDAGSDNEAALRRLYKLTPAEARLAVLIARGVSLTEASVLLEVGMTTLRTHLQRIFSKTETHHQAELVSLLLLGPARLSVTYHGNDADRDEERYG